MKRLFPSLLLLSVGAMALSAGSAKGSLLTGYYEAIPVQTVYDLTALGSSDWAYWTTSANPASGVATNEKAGGSLIGSISPIGSPGIRGSTSGNRPAMGFTFSDGTPPVSGTVSSPNPTGLFPTALNSLGSGLSLVIDLPTTETHIVRIWGAVYEGSARFTASLPGASNFVNTSLASGSLAPKGSALFTLLATPDAAGDDLTIDLVLDTSSGTIGHTVLSGAAVSVVPEPSTALTVGVLLGALGFRRGRRKIRA